MTLTIDAIAMPDEPGAEGWTAFLEYCAVANAVESAAVGSDLLVVDPEPLLAEYRDNAHRVRRHVAARIDGRIVGRGMITSRPATPETGVHLSVDVLPEHRGKGFGTQLADLLEQRALEEGASVIKVTVVHTVGGDGERVVAATGLGEVPAEDPGARVLRARGYVLEQVSRISRWDVDQGVGATGSGVVADDYAVVEWAGPTPPEHVADLAELRTRMSTDAPTGGLAMTVDTWDAVRVRDHDARVAASGRTMVTSAALHRPTGRLVGYSEIAVSRRRRVATQEDTLVLREHRGHRLGLRLKLATAAALSRVAPAVTTVVTWNAEENRPMLAVNEAMGYRAIGVEGSWQRVVDAADRE